MPLYIVHTRSAQHSFCILYTVYVEGYGRARAWRTRIMRISQKASLTFSHSSGEIISLRRKRR